MTSNGAEPLRNPATAADLDVTYPRGNNSTNFPRGTRSNRGAALSLPSRGLGLQTATNFGVSVPTQ